jgi:ABC-type Fe3+-hydroxamate transport system substrate-binding protein
VEDALDRHITRRALPRTVTLIALSTCSRDGAKPVPQGGIAALDWALAETLIMLGRPPTGVVAAADWANFVVEPRLPAQVFDLGLQQEVNFELIAMLRPDLILVSPFLQNLDTTLRRIAPTLNLSVYGTGSEPLSTRVQITRELADRVGVPQAADRMVAAAGALRAEATRRLSGLARRRLVFARFVDNRHARVFGRGSLYGEVLAWLGLENGWVRPVGYYGFSTIGIEELALVGDIELVVIDPTPPDIERSLSSSPLWTELPFVKAGRYGTLPPILMFGGLPSAERMVRLLVPHLERRWA